MNNTHNHYGINVMYRDTYVMSPGPLQGVTVNIYDLGATTLVWTGTTNSGGYAKDANNLSPSLIYGDYIIECVKYGYNTTSTNIIVPLAGNVNITMTVIYQTVDIIVSD